MSSGYKPIHYSRRDRAVDAEHARGARGLRAARSHAWRRDDEPVDELTDCAPRVELKRPLKRARRPARRSNPQVASVWWPGSIVCRIVHLDAVAEPGSLDGRHFAGEK
jgi:hypothetical protein